MDGMTELRDKLRADSTVTGLVVSYGGFPAIYEYPVIPSNVHGAAISMYFASPRVGGLEYVSSPATVNCYARTYKDALALQDAAQSAVNRKMEGTDTFFVGSKLPVIPPQSTGGDYNAPIEVLIRQR